MGSNKSASPPVQGASPPLPSPPPWAFAPYYAQPLPPNLQYNPQTGFGDMVRTIEHISAHLQPEAAFRVNAAVATYKNKNVKESWVSALNTPESEDLARGSTVAVAKKGFPASGSVGVVVSGMTNAAVQSASGHSDWHAVAMARQGNKVWVHDPAYRAEEHASTIHRMDQVPGTNNVRNLALEWQPVRHVWFQGPPPTYLQGPSELECMGRSVQWVQATVDGTLPWPPDTDATGGQWTRHYRN